MSKSLAFVIVIPHSNKFSKYYIFLQVLNFFKTLILLFKNHALVHCDLMMIWFDGQFVVLPLGRVGKNLLDNTGQVPW